MDTANPHIRAQALYAGLAAAEFTALTQLLGRESLSGWLHASVICFAVSIPGLVLFSLKRYETEDETHVCWDLFLCGFWFVSLLMGLLGLAGLFAHFRPTYGAVFVVCAAAAAAGI